MISPAQLAAIRERAERATPGPWCFTDDGAERFRVEVGDPNDDADSPLPPSWDNAEFIAHARTDIPALLAALEEQARETEAKDKMLEGCRQFLAKLAGVDHE